MKPPAENYSSLKRDGEFSYLLIVALAAVVAVLPIAISGLPNGADLWNHFRFALPFYESIRSGQFYPGWLAESNAGLGDPRFRFYPPGLYYLLAAARFVTGDWYIASIATIVLLSIMGGLGVYLWTRTLLDSKTAMWAGLLYSLVPYHPNELYQASLLSEYAACSVLPFAFLFVERICRRRSLLDVAGLGVTYSLLILTHLPMTVIGSLALAGYAVLRVDRKHIVGSAWRLGLGVFLALASSAFFWTTMLAELSWIKGNSAQANPYYDYRLNYLFSPSALTNRNTWYANLLGLAMVGFMMPAVVYFYRFMKDRRGMRTIMILLIGSFLMATPLSRPIWAIIPKLSEVQFPWRWLSITSLAGSVLVAASFPGWRERIRSFQAWHIVIVIGFGLSLYFVATQVVWDCEYVSRSTFQPMLQEIRGAVSFKDWLPKGANEFLQVEKMSGNVEAGGRQVLITSWGPQRRLFHVAEGPARIARVHTYFYPHWVATDRGRRLPVTSSADGVLLIELPPEDVDVELVFREPTRVHVATIVSICAWLSIAGLAAWGWRREFAAAISPTELVTLPR